MAIDVVTILCAFTSSQLSLQALLAICCTHATPQLRHIEQDASDISIDAGIPHASYGEG